MSAHLTQDDLYSLRTHQISASPVDKHGNDAAAQEVRQTGNCDSDCSEFYASSAMVGLVHAAAVVLAGLVGVAAWIVAGAW